MTEALQSEAMHLPLGGKSIEVAFHRLPGASRTILLLHEALGSVRYWKDFPQKLARFTGTNVLLYSRPGHGTSEGPIEPRSEEYYLRQSRIVLPGLLQHFSIRNPVLYGHSEGAIVAMFYAAGPDPVQALIVESPIVVLGEDTVQLIEKMTAEYEGSRLRERLRQYHRQPDAVFHAWVRWAIHRPEGFSALHRLLPSITAPTLVLQGAHDPFGTAGNFAAIEAAFPIVQRELFADCGHLPHREQTDRLLQRVARFLTEFPH